MSITDELREQAHGFHVFNEERLLAIADRIDAAVDGMIELPKDADDVPWNICDRDEDGNVVTQLRLYYDGWFVITDGEWPYRPERKRHYHAPTVEDMLREFICDHEEGVRDEVDLIAEYATRLRLAEGDA